VSYVAKKSSLKKVKLLKKGKGFWFVINVLGSTIKHDDEVSFPIVLLLFGHRQLNQRHLYSSCNNYCSRRNGYDIYVTVPGFRYIAISVSAVSFLTVT